METNVGPWASVRAGDYESGISQGTKKKKKKRFSFILCCIDFCFYIMEEFLSNICEMTNTEIYFRIYP